VRISRSKIDDFLKCPRCFRLDRHGGVSRPGSYPLTLNLAVDRLLKDEFDQYRALGRPHPLMQRHGIRAVPFRHPDLDRWRSNFQGLSTDLPGTDLTVSGAVDDVWGREDGELHVVDYKAIATKEAPSLEGAARASYRRQAEVYQWLLRRQGFKVSSCAYFVFVNGRKDVGRFGDRLKFSSSIVSHDGDDAWVEDTLRSIDRVLQSAELPPPSPACDFCKYRRKAAALEQHL
jgi:hypothetical protein